MKQELSERLIKTYPNVFTKIRGIECPNGWYDLCEQLAYIIEHHLPHVPEEMRGQIYATQWKEKFAGACFYMSHETPFISGAIAMAESMSHTICQDCGARGTPRTIHHWMATLCDEHYKVRKEERELMMAKKTP